MDRPRSVVTPKRFAQGMTFEDYVRYIGTPENLAREAGWWLGKERMDWSVPLRAGTSGVCLTEAQTAAIRWLVAQPGGPAKLLVISEEWSSDCRRDVPMLSRLADAGGMEMRIFTRDGQKVGRGPRADPAESPNADIVNEFLREQNGQTYQSVPVAVFYTRGLAVPPSLHRIPGDLPQGTHRRRHAGEKSGRDARAKVGELHPGLGRAPAGTVLPAVGVSDRGRDPLCALRADRGRAAEHRRRMTVKAVPRGPRGHLLLGSGPDLARDQLGFYAACARDYGDVVPAAPRAESRAARLPPGRHRGGPGHEKPGLHQEPRRPSARAGARQRAPAVRGRRLAAPAAARPARVPSAARPGVRRGDDRVHRAPAGHVEGRRRPRCPRRDDRADPGHRRQDALRRRRLGRELLHRAGVERPDRGLRRAAGERAPVPPRLGADTGQPPNAPGGPPPR